MRVKFCGTLYFAFQLIRVMIARWRSAIIIVNTNESLLPVFGEPYDTNKIKVQKGEEIKVLRNSAFRISYVLINVNVSSEILPGICVVFQIALMTLDP